MLDIVKADESQQLQVDTQILHVVARSYVLTTDLNHNKTHTEQIEPISIISIKLVD